jgi:two-component system cell cycle response regulator DivK
MGKKPDQHPTVLIVDDIEDNRTVMRDFLIQKHNCRVVEAEDGQAALKLALRESPALILMDIGLPKYGGLAVVAEMRKQRRLRKVPIVAVTAYDSPGLRLEAKKAGVMDYVTKPLHPEEFGALIDRFLNPSAGKK